MLFKQHHLTGIKSGSITLAFRKWKKPTVKKGSLIKTGIGQVVIKDIAKETINRITEQDATAAGFDTRDELVKQLQSVTEGQIYRIELAYHSADPRIALRNKKSLMEEDFLALRRKLARMDQLSKEGPWTEEVLSVIEKHPRLRAADLASLTSKEKDWLKLNIRKLKNLGLTISHETGYEISPLGKAFMKKITL